jgi:glucokinase
MFRIGIDIGGTNSKIGIVDEDGNIIFKSVMKTQNARSADVIVDEIGKNCCSLIKESKVSVGDIISIGVGAPGTPDKKNGIQVYANNIRFDNTDIRGILRKYIDKDIYVDNDANCAALAESVVGSCKGTKYSMTITLGTGVGSGAVLDGKLYSGFNYGAPELGHMVILVGGRLCTCGRRGCWEQYSSAPALIIDTREAIINNKNTIMEQLVESDLTKIDARTAFKAMRLGDGAAAEVVDVYIYRLAQGLANVINAFQPEVIALGGGVSNEGKVLLDKLDPIVGQEIYTKRIVKNCRLALATAGNDAGMIGAAMLNE